MNQIPFDVLCPRAPVLIYRAVPILIFDSLASRTTVGEVDVGHAFLPSLQGATHIFVSIPHAAEPTTINRASTSRCAIQCSGETRPTYWEDAGGCVHPGVASQTAIARQWMSPALQG